MNALSQSVGSGSVDAPSGEASKAASPKGFDRRKGFPRKRNAMHQTQMQALSPRSINLHQQAQFHGQHEKKTSLMKKNFPMRKVRRKAANHHPYRKQEIKVHVDMLAISDGSAPTSPKLRSPKVINSDLSSKVFMPSSKGTEAVDTVDTAMPISG